MSGTDDQPDVPVIMSDRSLPVRPDERFEIIDIVRGFALFGVLYINLLWTSQYVAQDSAPKGMFEPRAIDELSFMASEIFINHKFYTIFSILFGLGFALQLSRASQRGSAFLSTYAKRVVILFVIGAIHALLVWPGDVLHIYALLGMLLLLFHRCSNTVLLGWAGFVFAISVALTVIQWGFLDQAVTIEDTNAATLEVVQIDSPDVIESGAYQQITSSSYGDIIAFNWDTLVKNYSMSGIGPGSNLFWYMTIFWKFLLGMYFGRIGLLQNTHERIRFFKRAAVWALGIGIAGYALTMMPIPGVGSLFDNPKTIWLGWLMAEAGMSGLSVFYVCVLVLWYQTRTGGRVLGWLAPLGRMALTNYLMHSVVFIVMFYGIGFALLGKIGHAECLLITIGVYLGQILLSTWWLKRFRFGPMEWLWRSLTYGKFQTLRVRSSFRSLS